MFSRKLALLGILLAACFTISLSGCGDEAGVTQPVVTPPPVDEQPIPAPLGVNADYGANGSVSLQWQATASAQVAGYNVYRYVPAPDRENSYIKINSAPVSTTAYSYDGLAQGGYYRVKAVSATGRESASSLLYHVSASTPTGGGGGGGGDDGGNSR